jgi:dienelactone hydrolase
MKTEWVEYGHGTRLKAYMAYDDKVTGRRPAVLMIHARGVDAQTLGLAETWAKLGYVSFAADIFGYGQGVLPKDVPEMQAQTTIYSNDRALMRARTQAGYDTLLKSPMVDPAKVALIGYCFGGAVGVEFGSTGVPLAAMSRSTARSAITRRDGRRTPGHVPDPARRRGRGLSAPGGRQGGPGLRGAKVPFQLEVYSGTGHGFSTPKNKAEERANAQSIASTGRTLKELFGI